MSPLLCAAVQRHAIETPDRLAVRFLHDGEISGRVTELTYAQFHSAALEVAAALQQRLHPGDRALLLYEGGIDFIVAFFGCLYAGVIAVPTYPPESQRIHRTLPRLQAIVADAGATLVLCSSAIHKAAGPLCEQAEGLRSLKWLPTDAFSESRYIWRNHEIKETDIAYLQYTSGSTGTPKGVVITHSNLAWTCEDIIRRWSYQDGDHQVSWLPTFHDLGLIWGLLSPLLGGIPVTFMLPTAFLQRPARWLETITHFRGTHTGGPNFAYDLCVSKIPAALIPSLDLSSLRAAMNAAEPVRASTLESFFLTFCPAGFRKEAMCPWYGLAEATLQVTVTAPDEPPTLLPISIQAVEKHQIIPPRDPADTRMMVGCGRVAACNRLAIVDGETGNRLPEHQVGEVWVSGPIVGQGYWNQRQATAETFENRIPGEEQTLWLNTGDLGFLSNSELFISGRAKDVLIIRGRNIYPQDIEQEVERAHSAIRPGCVAAYSLEIEGEERIGLVAEIEPSRLAGDPPDLLLRPIRLAVADAFGVQLHDLVLIPPRGIFKTSSGKIQRRRTGAAIAAGELTILARWTAQLPTQPQSGDSKPSQDLTSLLLGWIREAVSLSLPDSALQDVPFRELGLDSASAVTMSGQLAKHLNRSLSPTLLFDYPTVRSLVSHLHQNSAKYPDFTHGQSPPTGAAFTLEPIAIIGMGCRFPGGSSSPQELFELLDRGEDTIQPISSVRWNGSDATSGHEPFFAALLPQVDQFDAAFFGISPREANMLDPQQRLLLEVAWEALEDAGLRMDQLSDSAAGVFVGLCTSDYLQVVRDGGATDAHSLTGTIPSTAAGRLSYVLGLRGPSLAIDTACSSSLVAVHLAVQSLRSGEVDLAIVAGVNLVLSQDIMQMLAQTQALSPDGRCKTFDVSANGYVRGEGCGVVVLKRYSDAMRDGDSVRACIRGSSVNHNAHSNGLTVPSSISQQALIRNALANARLTADDIDYVETHGTGTALGDPIEFEALRSVFGRSDQPRPDCVLGALKTNIGHLEAAAGIAGLIKVVACLQNQEIPGNLHLHTLNPRIDPLGTRFHFPAQSVKWPAGTRTRRAGVSSFGLSGTNAHVIVEEAPPKRARSSDADPLATRSHALLLSAKNDTALRQLAEHWAQRLEQPLDALTRDSLGDLVYTASCRRTHWPHRLAVVGDSREVMARQLRDVARGEQAVAAVKAVAASPAPEVVLVFSGQGSLWLGMGQSLMRDSLLFRSSLEACARVVAKLGGPDLLAILASSDQHAEQVLLHQMDVAQPALFAMQVGLWTVLRSFGVQPSIVMGHSVGEVAAAYAAGILSLDTAALLVLTRARAMSGPAGRGKMVAVELTEEAARLAIRGDDRLSVAAMNGPQSVVLAGDAEAVTEVTKRLTDDGVTCRALSVDFAFHSPRMSEAEQVFLQTMPSLTPLQADIPMISTVTGREVDGAALTVEYWSQNIRQPVRYASAVAQVPRVEHRGRVFVEVGPHPVLCSDIAAQLAALGCEGEAIPTLRRNRDDRSQLLTALAALHVRGVPIRWSSDVSGSPQVASLPRYPWQHKRFWVQTSKPKARPPIASDYYDAVTRIVESTQHEPLSAQMQGPFLTFAPFAQVIPGFSWLQAFARPQEHPQQVQLMQQQQLELRRALFRHVQFDRCKRALDFGCGMSSDLVRLALAHPQLTLDGYTISPEQAEVGRQRLKGQGLQDRVQVYCRDSAQEPFPGRYDLVFGFEVAHHIKDKAALFANIAEHLAPGGTLVLADFISNVAFEIEHDASSSFFLMVEQWTELLSAHGLKVQDVLDISRQISNFLHDPAFDEHLEQMRRAGEDENVLVSFQSYDRLGKMLDRGLASYILLSATKVTDATLESLRSHNRQALTRLIPYESSSSQSSNELSLLYGVDFRPTARRALTRSAASSWLLVSSRPETTAPLAALLRQRGEPCIEVHVGEQSVQVGPTQYQVDQSSALAYQQIFQHAFEPSQPCSHVVFLGALEVSESTLASPDQLGDELTAVCHRAVCLTQALVHHGFSRTPRLFLVTQGAQTPSSRDVVHPEQSVLWGLGKTIALEHPALRCTRIDVDPTVPLSSDSLSHALLDELSYSDREDQILLRGTNRLAARLVRVPLSPDVALKESGPLRRDRSYLITGGLGGLGLSLARWLCEQGAGSIILVGRNPPQAQQQASLEELAQSGFQVTTVQVDVCDVPSVKKLFTDLARSGLPLAGVFHLAGVLQDQTLLDLSEPTLRTVLLPKVQGAWNLHRLAPPSLDYFVLYSSAAALCGSLGQASYSAANSFLDALAQHRQSLGLPALSIQWGAFSGVGMAAHQGLGQRIAERGIESLSPDDGHRMLRSLLGRSLAVVGVLRLHARQWIESIPSAAALPFYSDLAKQSAHSTQLALGAQKLLIQLRQTPAEDRLPILLAFLQQQIGSVLLMEPERITAKTPFAGLGLDSLLSLEIRNRLEVSLGIRLQATALFTYPHVAALAQYVLERLDLGQPTGTPMHKPASRAQTDVPRSKDGRKLEQLSDEELAQMADELLS